MDPAGSKLVGSGAGDAFVIAQLGVSVALSCSTAVIGGNIDSRPAGGLIGAAWVFVAPPKATHDGSSDCLSDILWQNTTPRTIVQTGDFNYDGKSDIAWYNGTSGQVMLWLLDGTTALGSAPIGSATADWQIQSLNSD
jgi:hypothetical protein